MYPTVHNLFLLFNYVSSYMHLFLLFNYVCNCAFFPAIQLCIQLWIYSYYSTVYPTAFIPTIQLCMQLCIYCCEFDCCWCRELVGSVHNRRPMKSRTTTNTSPISCRYETLLNPSLLPPLSLTLILLSLYFWLRYVCYSIIADKLIVFVSF